MGQEPNFSVIDLYWDRTPILSDRKGIS